MKKVLLAILSIMLIASVAHAAVRLGTAKKPSETGESQTTWAHPKASPTGIINATGATKAYKTLSECDRGLIEFGTITGSNIMNVAVQTAPYYDPELSGALPPVFYNTVGSTSTPYHQVNPSNSDTWKIDVKDRAFDWWRLNCLVGCDLTNSIAIAHGDCRKAGE